MRGITMTTPAAMRDKIAADLSALPRGDFAARAEKLLATLGYASERAPYGETGDVDAFIASYPAETPRTKSEREFRESAESTRILFQLTDSEIVETFQPSLDDASGFDKGRHSSFLFAAVELSGEGYPRGKYAQFTREINKRFAAPTVVLFETAAGVFTLAFANRRENKRAPTLDVLGKVSLIREIDPANPHRAHLDLLAELSLDARIEWMRARDKPQDFDGLLAAWLDTLDTEELNRRFYRDLFGWFERAVAIAKFPTGETKTLTPEEHLIRLITRLMFVWFVKQTGLVSDALFAPNKLRDMLEDFDAMSGDGYYRAVLQNLFFATLNTEIGKRGFSRQRQPHHRDFSKYRYRSHMKDPDALLAEFDKTPFINGGLFDCLDSFDGYSRKGYRIDCFSDVHYHKLSIPNSLFFADDDREPGLITLFERYKFTVEENTPIEQEVALDPELLGKVFENLLAAYNPETRENARKQTGSYYTPRPIVDYMVDEALAASLAEKVGDAEGREPMAERVRALLSYETPDERLAELFDDAETDTLVEAIAHIRVLDPAVGSGAFPMGVLHKLTLALRRLDPRNERLQEISDLFEHYRDSDFGRKLYLIQNSIYGVDIQPVATQIAKLRFFISLAIEQKPTGDASRNYGIEPLPNLETRFVAANTIIGLRGPQGTLTSNRARELEQKLANNRESHFHATVRDRKRNLRKEDAKLRNELAAELEQLGMESDDADKIAHWDPYDQSASADWFDAKYMFGVADGFDVVIGNPPYVQLQKLPKNRGELGWLYKGAGYETFVGTGDIYQLFYERGIDLLRRRGLLAYITSNSWMRAEYGKSTRLYFSENHTPLRLLEMGKGVFENTIVDTNILIARRGKSNETAAAVDMDSLPDKTFPPHPSLWGELRQPREKPWSALSSIEQRVMDKMEDVGVPLKEWDVSIRRGVTTGLNAAFIIDDTTKRALISKDSKSAEIIKPILRGKDIQRYRSQRTGMHLIATIPALKIDIDQYPAVKNYLLSFGKSRLEQSGRIPAKDVKSRKRTPYSWFELQDVIAYHKNFVEEKLFWIDLTDEGRFAYHNGVMFCSNSAYIMTGESIKYLCALLNSNLVTWFMKNTALNSGMGTTRWVRFTVETIPIPQISEAEQRPFIRLVDEILADKAADPDADTDIWEWRINELVYELYGLTEEEGTAIERSLGLIHATDEEEDAALLRAMLEELESGERGSMEEVKKILLGDG